MHHLLDPLRATAAKHPDRLAISDPTLALSYAALHSVAEGLAAQIAARSTRPLVGILAPTSSAAAISILACWYAGKTPVPLNFLLAPEELGKIIADAGLDLILTIDRFAPQLAAVGVPTLLLNGKTLIPAGAISAEAARMAERYPVERGGGERSEGAKPPAPLPQANAGPDDLAVVLYTSGTLGLPKGVCLTMNNIRSNAAAAIEYANLRPEQVFLSVLPQFHSFGFTAMTVVPLMLGATVHYLPRFTPVSVAETIREKQVSIFMAVASMYAALLNLRDSGPDDFATVELAISGGEPLPESVAAEFLRRFGVTLYEGYGLTESSPIVSWNTPFAHRPGSVGRTLPGIEAFTIDAQGNRLAAGMTGEICIRGSCVMAGYRNRPEETSAVIIDNALRTGDLGHVDGDGYLHITGRAKEMLIVGGDNVFPREIENVLLAHPAVAEAAVIGAPDDLRGEVPVAFVILKPDATANDSDLRAHCRAHLAGFKVPRSITLAADLPRSPTGKILKRALPK